MIPVIFIRTRQGTMLVARVKEVAGGWKFEQYVESHYSATGERRARWTENRRDARVYGETIYQEAEIDMMKILFPNTHYRLLGIYYEDSRHAFDEREPIGVNSLVQLR